MALRIENVTKRFGKKIAVDQLSMLVEPGEMFGMLGANGAGKTTTFRMMIGLFEPNDGEVTWDGQAPQSLSARTIGYLPEERGLYPKLKVMEQMIYLGRLRGLSKKEVMAEVNMWLERFNIPHYRKAKVENLSKGNQQKVQFIAAVLHRPDLLILDEPFSGLDPINVDLLKTAVKELRDGGTTIVFSSHDMEHVESLCENLCIMDEGTPVVHGKLKDIKRTYEKRKLHVRADFPIDFLEHIDGVLDMTVGAQETTIDIRDEGVAEAIFASLQDQGGYVRHFSVEEPTLHDIFVEKVGRSYV
ncbi:ABC transporter ATP-binding protein [Natribacillus halophilus]|uniref:ABC-2 type transport system ATP-binding protein n=1 Tax=Natribacillus halophilus TaxID=549003 RepID=A0A1G8NVE2_9BACI|nr:ABC transporter ATP-binding protein [Natribacillus halophilus]SDI84187.1 ABC-2 type transport system ATP-binding protein [Natribacillus halophilus]